MSLPPIHTVAGFFSDGTKPSHLVQRLREIPSKIASPDIADTKEKIQKDEIETALDTLNQYTATVAPAIQFYKDVDTGLNVIKVVDTITEKVLRQIPSEEVLLIAKSIDKIRGLLINQKA